MTTYVLTYRLVKGAALTNAEGDANFHNLDDRVTVLEGLPLGVGVSSATISGNDITFHMSDGSLIGPVTVPAPSWVDLFTGDWQANQTYLANQMFVSGVTLYAVLVGHTSASSFDPAATDGLGHNLYVEILSLPTLGASVWRTGATFTPALTDENTYNRYTNSGGCAVTIPNDSTVNFAIDTELRHRQTADGPVTIVAASGVTINGMTGFSLVTAFKGAVITTKKVGANEWDLYGDLTEVITVAAPYDVSSGDGALVGSLFGVAQADALSGADVDLVTEGVFDLPKNSAEAWTVGEEIYWHDGTSKQCTTSSSGNTLIGVAVADAADPSSTGRVRLNGSF